MIYLQRHSHRQPTYISIHLSHSSVLSIFGAVFDDARAQAGVAGVSSEHVNTVFEQNALALRK